MLFLCEALVPLFSSAILYRVSMKEDISKILESRLGSTHAKLRLGVEAEHDAQVFGQGIKYFHIENLRSSQFVIASLLKLTGLYERGRRNAAQIELRRNYIRSTRIPKAFDGYTILHLSDLHVDISAEAMERLAAMLPEIEYDLCVLTGDFRGETFGPYNATMAGM